MFKAVLSSELEEVLLEQMNKLFCPLDFHHSHSLSPCLSLTLSLSHSLSHPVSPFLSLSLSLCFSLSLSAVC